MTWLVSTSELALCGGDLDLRHWHVTPSSMWFVSVCELVCVVYLNPLIGPIKTYSCSLTSLQKNPKKNHKLLETQNRVNWKWYVVVSMGFDVSCSCTLKNHDCYAYSWINRQCLIWRMSLKYVSLPLFVLTTKLDVVTFQALKALILETGWGTFTWWRRLWWWEKEILLRRWFFS